MPAVCVTYKGTSEQENAFKASLEYKEVEVCELKPLGLGEGDDCIPFTLASTTGGVKRAFTWTADDPKVYLLGFWATWDDSCQQLLAHNQEKLERNPAWEGKVEIVAISIDDSKEIAQKRISEKGWTKISSYWGGTGRYKRFNSNTLQNRQRSNLFPSEKRKNPMERTSE